MRTVRNLVVTAVVFVCMAASGGIAAGTESEAAQEISPAPHVAPASDASKENAASPDQAAPNEQANKAEATAAPPVQPERRWPREPFIDVLQGPVKVSNGRAQASAWGPPCFIFCTTYEASKDVILDSNDMTAVRIGLWGGDTYHYFGFAMEVGSTLNIKSPQGRTDYTVSVDYNPVSFLAMLRIPVVLNADAPRHQVDLYGGLAVTLAAGGNATVTFPELPQSVSVDVTGSGAGYFVGVSWRFSRIALFLERRWESMSFDYAGNVSPPGVSVSFDIEQTIFGLSLRF